MESKRVLGQFPCPNPDCNSSDAYTVWQKDGYKSSHCYSCGYNVNRLPEGSDETYFIEASSFKRGGNAVRGLTANAKATATQVSIEEGLAHPVRAIPLRSLNHSTCEHFGVRIGVSTTDGETPIYYLFPRYRNGSQVGWKTKSLENDYKSTGGSGIDLFGAWCCKPTGKKLWITEGEFDAMSVYQVLKENSNIPDWSPSVVSLPDGCQSVSKSLASASDFIDGYDEVIVIFDNDEKGIEARNEACKILAGKVSYVDLPAKDANEMLMNSRGVELKWQCLTHAKKYQPDGVVNAKDLWERYKKVEDTHFYPWPSSMPVLGQKTLGIQLGTVITITSGTGSGKSQFLREILYHLYNHTDEKIAGMFLEEDAGETIGSLLSLELNRRINLPDTKVPEDEEKRAFDKLFNSERISLYDFFGGMDETSLLSKLRYFAATGHKFIFLDHLSIVISEFATEGDERKKIDVLMSKLAKFAKEFKVTIFNVVHLSNPSNKEESFELGAVPTLSHLRGSGSIKHLSWIVIALSRNQQHPNVKCRNTTELNVLKCRLTGRTGVADYLEFIDSTGRMIETVKPANYRPDSRKSA